MIHQIRGMHPTKTDVVDERYGLRKTIMLPNIFDRERGFLVGPYSLKIQKMLLFLFLL